MPPKTAKGPAAHLALICGDEDQSVNKRARELFDQWTQELNAEAELVQAHVTNAGEAMKTIGKLREALQTLPFFGSGKVVWFKGCNFLAEDRTSASAAVTETLAELAEEFQKFPWGSTRLIISAGKVDKRRGFYKTIDKLGSVESFAGWSSDDKDWGGKAEDFAISQLKLRGKQIAGPALGLLINSVGPNKGMLESEVEKLSLYVSGRERITEADVEVITVKNKTARAFALGDALGERNLALAFRMLNQEFWEMERDTKNRSEIGLLYGLISKVRAMLFSKALLSKGFVKINTDYGRFKDQLAEIPLSDMPEDKRVNPLALNPYVLYRAMGQSAKFTDAELVRGMELLLQCNQKLVTSGMESSLVLQQTLVQIIGGIEKK